MGQEERKKENIRQEEKYADNPEISTMLSESARLEMRLAKEVAGRER